MLPITIKRFTLAALTLVAIASSGATTSPSWATTIELAPADARATVSADVGDLKLQLEKGLRARRPEEFAFVDLVVGMVAADELPLKLVKSTFLWARKKGLTTRYPFPYFERALRLLAAKQGINIPAVGQPS